MATCHLQKMNKNVKLYKLLGADGKFFLSSQKGNLGGYCKRKIYGRLDCPSALRFIAKGYYAQHRVFFANEATAIEAGYRPCAVCMPFEYKMWKQKNDRRRK